MDTQERIDTQELIDAAEVALDEQRLERAQALAVIAMARSLADIAESLARIASTVGDEELLSGRSIAVLRAVNPFQF